MQYSGPDLPHGSASIPRSDGKPFLIFIYIWQENDAQIPKLPGAMLDVNPAGAITWLVNVTF